MSRSIYFNEEHDIFRQTVRKFTENRLRPHAGGTAAEAGELQRHHQPHVPRRLADAGRVREHDVALERGEIVRGDVNAGQLPESGVDAVDRLTLRDDRLDRARTRLDRRHGGGIEPDPGAVGDGAPIGERNAAGRQGDRHRPPRTRACSGLNPIR